MEYMTIEERLERLECIEEENRKMLERIERNTMPKPKAEVLGRALSANAVAQMLGVAVQTVYKWTREEKLRGTRVGGRILYSNTALEQFLERRDI